MVIIRDVKSLREALREVRMEGRKVGFVPTMGALHTAHISLVKIACERSDYSVVSIFVNPTQFGPAEDFERYPRTPEEDCRLLEAEGVDLVFIPTRSEMYAEDETITIDPGVKAQLFEGRSRPTHFRGVLTVVAKLFDQVQPDLAVFGEKDAQQLYLVREMAKNLQMPVEIIAGPTLRELDGLALSSRNRYLKKAERELATVLYHALTAGVERFQSGERSLEAIRGSMREAINEVPEFEVDYFTAVSDADFEETDPVSEHPRMIIAGRIGSVRLIDNLCPSA
ncbi:pantoate--beta-alanine ligase [bacterium]|nr:MAG: pantoate--beta-alanine ligase [bacterium]